MNLLSILKYSIEIVVFMILWIDWDRFSWYKRDDTSKYPELMNSSPEFRAMSFEERQKYYYKYYNIKFYRRMNMKQAAAVLVLITIFINIYIDVADCVCAGY